VQAKGLRRGDMLPARWEDVADHHWRALTESLAAARSGRAEVEDVVLAGYSYGGYIAMAMAERARAAGARNVPVILIDTPHPSVVPKAAQPTPAVLLQALFHQLGLDVRELDAMDEAVMVRHVFDRAVAAHLLPAGMTVDRLSHLLAVAVAHARIHPPVGSYDFRMSLLRAREGASRLSDRADLGWDDYSRGTDIHWVGGRHETMLEAEHARDVADVMRRIVGSGDPGTDGRAEKSH